MSLKKFRPQDITLNTMKAHPSCEFFIYDGNIYYNNLPYQSGTINHGANLVVSSGCISLYELNIDRLSESTDRFIGGTTTLPQPLNYNLASGFSSRAFSTYTDADTGEVGIVPISATTPYYGYPSTAASNLVGWWQLVANVSGIATDAGAPASDHLGNITDLSSNTNTMKFLSADVRPGTCPDWNVPLDTDVIFDCSPGRTAPGVTLPQYVQAGFMTASCNFVDSGDSNADYAYINPAGNELSFTNGSGTDTAFSIAMWVRPELLGDWDLQYLFNKNAEYEFYAAGLGTTSNATLYLRLYDGDTSNYLQVYWSTARVWDNTQWYHLVITYDGSETTAGMKLYVNGEEDTTGAGTETGTYAGMDRVGDDLMIGTWHTPATNNGTYNFNGLMSEMAVWSSELSANAVRALYDARDGDLWDQSGVTYTPWNIPDMGRIYSYVSKDSTYLSYNSVVTASDANYVTDFSQGDIMTASYPLSSSIIREYMSGFAGQLKTGDPGILPPSVAEADVMTPSEDEEKCSDFSDNLVERAETMPAEGFYAISCNKPVYRHYWALKSTLDAYGYMSEHYKLTASVGPGGAKHVPRALVYKDQQEINLISIPSIFFGSKIKPGSLSLKWYYTGSLIAELQDTKQNGELIQVAGDYPDSRAYASTINDATADGTGSVAGVVLYNEGFILLTGSWALNPEVLALVAGTSDEYSPSWKFFAAGARDGVTQASTGTSYNEASFTLSFKGTTETQTMTMFANAQKGKANFSNNPTYLNYSSSIDSSDNADPNVWVTTSSFSFEESPDRTIVNFVSSAASDYSASFQRQVYISRVAIYDDNKNLIGVATLANPVRKKEDEDLTFKLKLDI